MQLSIFGSKNCDAKHKIVLPRDKAPSRGRWRKDDETCLDRCSQRKNNLLCRTGDLPVERIQQIYKGLGCCLLGGVVTGRGLEVTDHRNK